MNYFKIIEDKYLRKEKDFIRWTKFISDKINLLYPDEILGYLECITI